MNRRWLVLLWMIGVMAVLTVIVLPNTTSAQDSTDTEPSGKLVVVPSYMLEVGQRTDAVAFQVRPRDLEVAIEYDHHLTEIGEPCDDAGGLSESGFSSLTVRLEACQVGEAIVQLIAVETGAVIADYTVNIIERSPPTHPTIDISLTGNRQIRPRVPVQVMLIFSEVVTGFDHTDIVVTNGRIDRPVREDGEVFVYEVSATEIAEVTLNIDEGAAHGAWSNLPNKAPPTFRLGMPYDDSQDGAIDRKELLVAISDYLFEGLITRDEILEAINLYLFGPIPQLTRCPQFREGDYRDPNGLANIHVVPFKSIVEEAIEEELNKPEVIESLEIEEGTDLTARLFRRVLGDTLTSPVMLSDGLYQYTRIYVEFLFDEGLQKGEASVWLETDSANRKCVVTGVDLLTFETFEPTNCPVIVPDYTDSGYRYLEDRVVLHPNLVEKIIEAIKQDLKDPYTIESLNIEGAGEATEIFIGNEGTGDYLTGPRYALSDGRELYRTVHQWAGAEFEDGSSVSFHVWSAPSPVTPGVNCRIEGVAIQPSTFVPI